MPLPLSATGRCVYASGHFIFKEQLIINNLTSKPISRHKFLVIGFRL